jgi:hypothetical protein
MSHLQRVPATCPQALNRGIAESETGQFGFLGGW